MFPYFQKTLSSIFKQTNTHTHEAGRRNTRGQKRGWGRKTRQGKKGENRNEEWQIVVVKLWERKVTSNRDGRTRAGGKNGRGVKKNPPQKGGCRIPYVTRMENRGREGMLKKSPKGYEGRKVHWRVCLRVCERAYGSLVSVAPRKGSATVISRVVLAAGAKVQRNRSRTARHTSISPSGEKKP